MEAAYYLLEYEKKGEADRAPELYRDMIEAVKAALEASKSWIKRNSYTQFVKLYFCILSEGDYFRRDRSLTELLGIKDPDYQLALACEKYKQPLITFSYSYNVKKYPLTKKPTSWTEEAAQLDYLMCCLRRGENITPDSIVYIRATSYRGKWAYYMDSRRRSERDIETTFKAAPLVWNKAKRKSMEV